MFILSIYANNSSNLPKVISHSGFIVVNSKEKSDSSDNVLSVTYVGTATSTTAEVVFLNSISNYNFAAYQV